jgi:hypothetical protein
MLYKSTLVHWLADYQAFHLIQSIRHLVAFERIALLLRQERPDTVVDGYGHCSECGTPPDGKKAELVLQ